MLQQQRQSGGDQYNPDSDGYGSRGSGVGGGNTRMVIQSSGSPQTETRTSVSTSRQKIGDTNVERTVTTTTQVVRQQQLVVDGQTYTTERPGNRDVQGGQPGAVAFGSGDDDGDLEAAISRAIGANPNVVVERIEVKTEQQHGGSQ